MFALAIIRIVVNIEGFYNGKLVIAGLLLSDKQVSIDTEICSI